MKAINPKLLLVLAIVAAWAAYTVVSNPHKKYSRQDYWQTATVQDVYSVPEEAILPGNKNGSVLMWAASATKDPRIISALVERGAEINEEDIIFSGTPLSAAAAYNSNPQIIDELIKLGAEINKTVGSNDKTPLIIAAELNSTPEIIESLIRNGADLNYRDSTGHTALEQAKRFHNEPAVKILQQHTK